MELSLEKIAVWKDAYKGETAWILGSGPSLDELPPEKVGPHRFALNLTILIEAYRDSWWICRDGRAMKKWLYSNRSSCIGEDRRYADTLFTDHAGTRRVTELDIGPEKLRRIVCTGQRFYTGETILVLALQIADYMGFSEIVLAGVDLLDPGGVAYAKEINWQSTFTAAARPARYNRMRRDVARLSTAMNAKVWTVSPHLADIFEEIKL